MKKLSNVSTANGNVEKTKLKLSNILYGEVSDIDLYSNWFSIETHLNLEQKRSKLLKMKLNEIYSNIRNNRGKKVTSKSIKDPKKRKVY